MTEILPPVTQQELDATEKLQVAAVETYLAVAQSLQAGMSETAIAAKAREEMANRGVNDFWYNIPIMVLVGQERFKDMALPDYGAKSPREDVSLQEGDVFFIDMHPRDEVTQRWGNFAATGIFKPREDQAEQIALLREMQDIQEQGIGQIEATQAGSDVAARFGKALQESGIHLLDVRSNYGHRMLSGPKNWEGIPYPFLDEKYTTLLSGQIVGIEIGGTKPRSSRPDLVARFEDNVHIPQNGHVQILGRWHRVPVVFP